MPDRSRIHSSEESIRSTISELGIIREGRYAPTLRIRECEFGVVKVNAISAGLWDEVERVVDLARLDRSLLQEIQ
jgi:hypothetical protein